MDDSRRLLIDALVEFRRCLENEDISELALKFVYPTLVAVVN